MINDFFNNEFHELNELFQTALGDRDYAPMRAIGAKSFR